MNLPILQLRALASNPHTSISAGVYVFAKFGARIAGVWWPAHKAQIDATAEYVEGAAVGWGLMMAGDASKTLKDVKAVEAKVDQTVAAVATGDTTLLPKPTEKKDT